MKHLILFEEANKLIELNEFNKAVSCYEEAISIKSDYVEAYYNLGNLHHGMGNLDKAVRNFKKIVALNPEYSKSCLLYTSPSPRDQRGSRMPSSA